MGSRLAFIGVGNMGGRMSRRLLAAGHQLSIYDPAVELVDSLVAGGAAAAPSPAEAARDAELVILSLPTPAIVEAVVTGEEGVLRTARPGTTVIDMSTGEPGTARRVEATCRVAGVKFLAGVLTEGTGGSWLLSNHLPATIFAGDEATRFALELMHKDVWLFMRAAEEQGLATPLAATAAQTLRMAKSEGYGPRDYSAIIN